MKLKSLTKEKLKLINFPEMTSLGWEQHLNLY